MTADPTFERRTRGRPRSSSADERIWQAALGELAEVGYERLKLRRVAERAGVARSTLYRRWSTKRAFGIGVADDLFERFVSAEQDEAELGLESALDRAAFGISRGPYARCAVALAIESAHNPELAEHCVARLDEPRRARIRAVLQRGIEQGELREDVDVETVIDLLISVVLYRTMFRGCAVPVDYGRRVLATLLTGVAPARVNP